MTKTLSSTTALSLVRRVEALNDQISEVYTEAREYEGVNNDNVIRDAVEARSRMREAASDAEGYIGSFDYGDDGERITPPSDAAWPHVSAKLRKALFDRPSAMKQVDVIDRLFALGEENGIRQPTLAELQAALPDSDGSA